jgi:hypothetical protein
MRGWVGALAVFLGAASAAAQAPAVAPAPAPAAAPPHTVEGLTIPAKPLDPDTLRAMVQDFVRLHGEPSRVGKYAFWARPLCPVVVGLPDSMDAFITHRIVEVGESVGAPRARRPSDCRHFNVLVVVTGQPQQLLDYVRRRQPELLGFHYAAQAERIAVVRRPIQAWHVTSTANGGTIDTTGMTTGDTEVIDDQFTLPPSGSAGSRFGDGLATHLLTALIVVSSRRIEGQPIGRVADQIAMEALIQPAPTTKCSEGPTILDALEPSCAASTGVESLTDFDLAYLKGLYHADPGQYLSLQRSDIGSRMKHDLAAAPASAPAKP